MAKSTHLFVAVRGQVEDQDGEQRHNHAGEDQIDGVEERLASERHVEGDIWWAAAAAAARLCCSFRVSWGQS